MGDLPSSSRVVPIPPVRISLVDPIPKLSPFTSLPFNGRSPLLVSSPLVQITSRLPFPMSSKSPPASCLPITSRLPSFSSLANHLPPYVIKSHRTCGSNGRLRLRVDPSCLARRHCPPVLLLMGRSAGSTLVGGPSVLRVDARLEAEGVPASRTLVLATLLVSSRPITYRLPFLFRASRGTALLFPGERPATDVGDGARHGRVGGRRLGESKRWERNGDFLRRSPRLLVKIPSAAAVWKEAAISLFPGERPATDVGDGARHGRVGGRRLGEEDSASDAKEGSIESSRTYLPPIFLFDGRSCKEAAESRIRYAPTPTWVY